jgi:hypothetical protein
LTAEQLRRTAPAVHASRPDPTVGTVQGRFLAGSEHLVIHFQKVVLAALAGS